MSSLMRVRVLIFTPLPKKSKKVSGAIFAPLASSLFHTKILNPKPLFLRLSVSHHYCLEEESRMKLKVVCRKVCDYVRYDLKEIAFPSSLPDPPHVVKRGKLTWAGRWYVLKRASKLYAASWVRDIGPDLRPDDFKKDEESGEKLKGENVTSKEREPSTLEDLAVAARGGMETLRPALQRVYMTRASAYRDALKSFIQGYQEGIHQAMEKKEEPKSEQSEDSSKKSG